MRISTCSAESGMISRRPSMIIEELPCWPWPKRAGTSRAINPTDGFGSLRPHAQPDCMNFTSQQHRSRRSGTDDRELLQASGTKHTAQDAALGGAGPIGSAAIIAAFTWPWPKQKLELQHARSAAMSGQCGCCAITPKHTVPTDRYRRKGRYAARQDMMPSNPQIAQRS